MLQRQTEEKKILSSNHYPLEPMYIPTPYSGKQPDTGPGELQRGSTRTKDVPRQKRTRRIIMWLLEEERDIDYFLGSESESDYEYQSYVEFKPYTIENIMCIKFFF